MERFLEAKLVLCSHTDVSSICRRLRIQLLYLHFAKLYRRDKKRVVLKLLTKIVKNFTCTCTEDVAEQGHINFVTFELL